MQNTKQGELQALLKAPSDVPEVQIDPKLLYCYSETNLFPSQHSLRTLRCKAVHSPIPDELIKQNQTATTPSVERKQRLATTGDNWMTPTARATLGREGLNQENIIAAAISTSCRRPCCSSQCATVGYDTGGTVSYYQQEPQFGQFPFYVLCSVSCGAEKK